MDEWANTKPTKMTRYHILSFLGWLWGFILGFPIMMSTLAAAAVTTLATTLCIFTFAIFFYVQFFRTFDFMFLIYSLLAGYGFAWVAHFFVEHNKPATFTYPFYSFIGDHKMYIEILLGKHKIF